MSYRLKKWSEFNETEKEEIKIAIFALVSVIFIFALAVLIGES